MRYLIAILIIVGLVFLYFYKSHGCQTRQEGKTANISSGVISYGKDSLSSLKGNGLVTLEGTYVRGPLEVNGSLSAKDAHIGSLIVTGHASLEGCVIDGKASVKGFLSAENTTFQDTLGLTTQKASFENSTLSSVVIHKSGWAFGTQELILSKKTICKGPITFESGKGKIILSDDSQILGPVEGAVVEKQ
jgi:hypothetical protein